MVLVGDSQGPGIRQCTREWCCDVAGIKIAGTADAQCVGPTAAAEEDTKIVHVAVATGNKHVGFVIDFNGAKIVDVVIGFELE